MHEQHKLTPFEVVISPRLRTTVPRVCVLLRNTNHFVLYHTALANHKVTDACRGSLHFEKAGSVCELLKAFAKSKGADGQKSTVIFKAVCNNEKEICLPEGMKKLEIANIKNRMSEGARGGELDVAYRDSLVNIKMYKEEDGGDYHIAELQLHLKKMVDAKSNPAKGGHLLYRIIRTQQEKEESFKSRYGHNYDEEEHEWWTMRPLLELPEGCSTNAKKFGECKVSPKALEAKLHQASWKLLATEKEKEVNERMMSECWWNG